MRLATASALLTHVASAGIASLSARPDDSSSDDVAGGLPVNCVAFQDAPGSSNSFHALRIGQCLAAGDAICSSSTGSWAFGIDPTDRMIKLWKGNRVSR